MIKCWFRSLMVLAVLCPLADYAQMPGMSQMQGEKIDTDAAIDRALKSSSLTFEGKPFHAVVEIGTAGTEYSGRVEVWWVDATKYRLKITSPKFSQEKVVNAGRVSEKNDGDYYPRWLENFVLAVMDPVPMAKNFRGRKGVMGVGSNLRSCMNRDDRPGGITDQMTWGMLCFTDKEPRVSSVMTTNMNIEFKDWKGFGKKQIARTYNTDVLDYKLVVARMTTLDELKQPDEAMFVVTAETPKEQQIATVYVPTLKEESLVEKAPVIEWPPVREGKTEGYMIVYARTDRTGQVRETSKHNSDQPGLENFGMQEALQYKFRPLMVDGVAQQMEMPLVLHFSTKIGDPLPNISGEELLKQISDCDARLVAAIPSSERVVPISISVNEAGKLTGEGVLAKESLRLPAVLVRPPNDMLTNCRYAPLVRNGVVTYYHGQLLVAH